MHILNSWDKLNFLQQVNRAEEFSQCSHTKSSLNVLNPLVITQHLPNSAFILASL